MDSKQVTKEINSVIRPILKEAGFDNFTSRTYWRYLPNRIDVLNFQSFNSYHAELMGITTYSFAVNLATYLTFIPIETGIKEKNGLMRPLECDGHFRSRVKKGIEQKKLGMDDVWYVDKIGNNLAQVVLDCNSQIENNALSWYNQFEDMEHILQTLLEGQEDMNGTWGFGNVDSPHRNRLIAFTAIELGNYDLAKELLEKNMVFYKEAYAEMKIDYYLDRIKETKGALKKIKTTHNTK